MKIVDPHARHYIDKKLSAKSRQELLRLAKLARRHMAECLAAVADISPSALMGYGDNHIELKIIQLEMRRRKNAHS